jgi:hypothetical protein
MSRIRELIGTAVRSSDLRMTLTEERAIDRVAALASTSSLGASILRLRYGHDAHAYRPVRTAVVRRITRKVEADPKIVDRLAARVLLELVDDQCEHCHGRTWVQRGSARQPCRTCSATGKRIPRDIDRAQALGLPVEVYLRHWARRLERMLDTLRGADARAARRLQIDLERRMVSPPTKSQPAQSSAPRSPLEPKNMGVRHEGIARPQESKSPQAEAAGFCV